MPKFINFAYKTAFFGNEVNPNEPIDYSKASGKENIKRKLANFFENFKYNLAMNTINSLFSMLLVFHYILSTFNIENMRNTSWGMICFILNTYFLFEFIIRLYSSKNPKIYLFSQDSLIDIFSITPYYIVRFNYAFSFFEEFDDNVFDLANIFSFIRIMKIEKCLLFIVKIKI